MLANARKLNPDCTFVQGDMREFSLSERFDAILIDDAVCVHDLARAISRGSSAPPIRHLEPGGVMIVSPDKTKETFEQNESHITHAQAKAKPEGVDVVFIENNYDPDPTDDTYEALIIYLIREKGVLRVVEDMHTLGIFAADVWPTLLREAGFEVHEDYLAARIGPDVHLRQAAGCPRGGQLGRTLRTASVLPALAL